MKTMRSIYTVIITDTNFSEYSTVSFEEYNDAIDYVIGELNGTKGFKEENIRDILIEQDFYELNGVEFRIESANLVFTKKRKIEG